MFPSQMQQEGHDVPWVRACGNREAANLVSLPEAEKRRMSLPSDRL